MKKTILFLWCLILVCSIETWYTNLSYVSDFSKTIRYGENTEEIINKAQLLEKYSRNYQKKLYEIRELYNIKTSPILDESEEELEKIIDSLIKLQSKYILAEDAEVVLKSIISGLRDINTNIEPYIRQQQQLYKEELSETKREYIIIWNKISKSLLNFIQKLSSVLAKKENLTPKQKEVIKSLARLNENREKIKEFETTVFHTKWEMKTYYIKIIKSIRHEIKEIKTLLR